MGRVFLHLREETRLVWEGNLALIIIARPLADLSQARVDQDLILYRERRNVLCRSANNEGLLASPPFILLWRQLILPLFPLKTMW